MKIMADQKENSTTSVAGSHYTVLARRFRPQAFDDVIGQEHVARALRNAIRAGRVAHAYLFTGARGVGKTSTARILAKALNCPNVHDGVPCNQCEICEGITSGNDVDVLEIDGASNRGIDDIRSLRANVGVRSMRTQYKVYIIDEVHMLTREAFNALLKTLEEPPPNVKFVFCTTEPNKVPDTILSRCQRFDFSAIGETSIAQRLGEIAKAEGFEVSDDALELVARRARGSMRDSQSLFDQLLAFSEGTVSAEDVHRMLGTAGDERLVEMFAAIIEHRPGEVLTLLEDSLAAGVQAGELMDQSIGYVRDLMVIHAGGASVPLCAISGRFREQLADQSKRLGMHSIMAAFQILADAKNQMFRSTFSRTILEMSLIQVSLLENLSAISELLSGRLPAIPDMSGMIAAVNPSEASKGQSSVSSGGSEEKKNADSLTGTPADISSTSAAVTTSTPSGLTTTSIAWDDASPTVDVPEDLENQLRQPADEVEATDQSAVRSETVGATKTEENAAETAHAASPAPELMLAEASMPQLLKMLTTRLGLSIAGGLRQSAGIFLRTPNVIEVRLDKSYEAARTSLDLPSNRMQIEAAIREITGQSVELKLALIEKSVSSEANNARSAARPGSETTPINRIAARDDANTPPKSATASEEPQQPDIEQARPANRSVGLTNDRAARAADNVQKDQTAARTAKPASAVSSGPPINLLKDIDPSRDNFVQHVIDTFGATVVRIMPAPSSVPGQAEE